MAAQITKPTNTGAFSPGNPAGASGSNSYTANQYGHWKITNFAISLFDPSDYGNAGKVETPTSLKVGQTIGLIGLGAASGGLAGVATAGALGAEAAATWTGAFVINAAGGAAGSFVQDALTQAVGNQPFSFTQLGTTTLLGGGTGGVLGVGFKAVGGLVSSATGNVAADEAAGAGENAAAGLEANPAGCFCAGTLVLTPSGRNRIENVNDGRRILSTKSDEPGPDIDPALYRRIRLRLSKDGQDFHMSFLRPVAMLRGVEVGGRIDLSVLELEIKGAAEVLSIKPCPPIEAGIGHVVTGTFTSQSIDVRLVMLQGLDAPIEVTGNHPIFSEDRQDFVIASKLRIGERLRTRDGIAVVESVGHRLGSWDVVNLEIAGAHQYYVTEQSVLVHNANGIVEGGPHSETKFPVGDELDSHHIPPKSISGIDPEGSPAIKLSPLDHIRTSSFGSSAAANAYRATLQELLTAGNVSQVFAMEIRDVRSIFGSQANTAIIQMLAYARSIKYL